MCVSREHFSKLALSVELKEKEKGPKITWMDLFRGIFWFWGSDAPLVFGSIFYNVPTKRSPAQDGRGLCHWPLAWIVSRFEQNRKAKANQIRSKAFLLNLSHNKNERSPTSLGILLRCANFDSEGSTSDRRTEAQTFQPQPT